MNANVAFWTVLAVAAMAILVWGVRVLPREHMQILATMPLRRAPDGQWEGVNLTWYGVLQAFSTVVSVALALVLAVSAEVPILYIVALTGLLLLICLPAARVVARLVERKKDTFTVGGAVFVGILLMPWLAQILDRMGGESHALASMSALAVCYPLGEGFGRLACISFGCCYGRRLNRCGPWLRRIFGRVPAIVVGPTRKAAYAGQCDGVPLLPVPALGAFVLCAAGLLGVALFLFGNFRGAGVSALLVAFLWRFGSEFLRADYRGGGRVSAYQWMALLSIGYALGTFCLLPATARRPLVSRGLAFLWTPSALLLLAGLGVAVFVYLGVSRVTDARVTLKVRAD